MENEQDTSLDSWDDFISGNFLKAANVNSEEEEFVVTEVSQGSDPDGQGKRVRLHLERNNQSFDFDVNKTNALKLKELGIASPKGLIGKKLSFKKVLVRNPKTNTEVDGLRIHKVE